MFPIRVISTHGYISALFDESILKRAMRIILGPIETILKERQAYRSSTVGRIIQVLGHSPLISSLIATLINVDSNDRMSSLNSFTTFSNGVLGELIST